jgi:hypothetical protein
MSGKVLISNKFAFFFQGCYFFTICISLTSISSFNENIQANFNLEPSQKIIWIDTVNVIATDRQLLTKSTFNSARSSQIIPSFSNGYVKCDWHVLSQAKERGWKFGLINVDDPRTVGNIIMTVNFLVNSNTDVYEGATYQNTISGGTSIQQIGVQHRWRVDRLTKKIYYETASNGLNWILRATYSKNVNGDLRAAFYGNESGKIVLNATIQADKGLIY